MPRANRYYLPGYVWHLTQRCHRKQFLLKFARDRRAWVAWLYAARRRYGLCVLDYTVTSNHIHLLVRDQGRGGELQWSDPICWDLLPSVAAGGDRLALRVVSRYRKRADSARRARSNRARAGGIPTHHTEEMQ